MVQARESLPIRGQHRVRPQFFALTVLVGLAGAAMLSLRPSAWLSAQSSNAVLTLEGEVIRLADLLKKEDIQLDPDAAPLALALRTRDGKVLPIAKTLGSRALFQDGRLLNRPVQVRGRIPAGIGILVIERFYTLKNDIPHEVYYWCETCAIRRDYPDKGVCECCGSPMELREVPLPR